MKMFATIQGIKRSKGTLDNGKPYDSTTLYVNLPFGDSEDMRGSSTQPMKYGTSENYNQFNGVQLPFQAEIDVEVETNGNRMQNVIKSVKPVGVKAGDK